MTTQNKFRAVIVAYPKRQGVLDCCSLGLQKKTQINLDTFVAWLRKKNIFMFELYSPFPTKCKKAPVFRKNQNGDHYENMISNAC